MVHFAKLTLSTGKPVYINCEMVAAIYKPNDQSTIIQFADDDVYIRVDESVETAMDIIYDAMQEQ